MKKFLSIILSLCMILTIFSSATVLADVTPDIVAEVVTSDEGDGSFTIAFYSTSEKVEAFGVTVNFDATKYTLTTTKKSAVFNSALEGTTSLNAQETKILFNWFSTYGGLKDKNTYNEDEDTYESLAPAANGMYEIAHISFALNKAALTDSDYDNKLKIDFEDYSFAAPTDTVPTVTYVEFNIPDTRTEIEGLTATAVEGLKFTGTAFAAEDLITVNALDNDTVEYTTFPAEVLNAGNYKVIATVKRAGNKPTTVSADVTIGKKDIEVTMADKTITYGDALPEFTSDAPTGVEITPTVAANPEVPGVDITATANDTTGNYNVTVKKGYLTVNKKAINVTMDDKTITYGDALPEFTSDAPAGVTINPTVAANPNAGTVEITATAESNNYDVTVVPGTLTVNTKVVKITAQDELQVYGDGILTTFKPAVVEGEVEGDPITEIVVGFQGDYTDTEGDYTVEVKSYVASANYDVETFDGKYLIRAAIPVNITFGENKKTYGDGDTAETVVTGDVDKVTITRVKGLNKAAVDTYTDAYEVALIADTDEVTGLPYALNVANNVFVVEPKAATITIEDDEKKVGDADPEFTATYEGFLEGEEPAEITFTRTAGETAGEYAITTAYADANYDITVDDGILTISKYALTVKAPVVVVYVGKEMPTLEATIEGAAEGDTITATIVVKNDVPAVVDPATIDTSIEADYTTEIDTTDADTDKYDVITVPGTITVRKASGRPSGGGTVIKPATGGTTTKPEDKEDENKEDEENKASANIAMKENAEEIKFIEGFEDKTFRPDVNATRNDVVAALTALFDITDVENAPEFEDTDDKAITDLAAAGVIDGYEDGSFKGYNDITRAEFVKLLAAALKLEAVEGAEANFTDIDGHWAAEWIKTFVGKGYLVGYPDGTFKPEAKITRAEMVVVITRVVGTVDAEIAATFADVDDAHWAYDYIKNAAK